MLGLTLAISFALTALTGLDPTWEGPGGMPGTGDPIPVFGMVAFAIAVTVVGRLGSGLGRISSGAATRLGLKRETPADPNEGRLVGEEVQKRIVHRCQVARRAMERARTKKQRSQLLDESATEIWDLAAGHREWIVQVRERPARDDNRYINPTKWREVTEHLGEVLDLLDARKT